ncbi:hypothetical protein R1flu_010500 [Riccia fluitans]|uniref:Uncharacterized protein n=1 Tax=Riccia fluitans TaxID=41844 RepID=A0ABD1Z558_9MARC
MRQYIQPLLRRQLYPALRRNQRAESRRYTVQEQQQRDLDDTRGLIEPGESRVPFTYSRIEPYAAYRYQDGPNYDPRRPVSPRRQSRGLYDWSSRPRHEVIQFSNETGHYSEDRGSVYGVDRWDGRGDFQAFTHHPRFGSFAEDQRYGVGGPEWANPNPRELDPPIVQDVMDQSW